MATFNFTAFEKYLKAFDFTRLFPEVLGWNRPGSGAAWRQDATGDIRFERRTVAELGGVAAIQVVIESGSGWPDAQQSLRVWRHIADSHAENLLIFTNRQENAWQSLWYWVKRDRHPQTGKPRLTPRRHEYFKGQPVDLFAGKLQAMVVEMSELDATGRMPVLEAARRIANALDVEQTTKKFFDAYKTQHLELFAHIQGIDDVRSKRWYASVLLNRLMFVWFLQKKGFLQDQNGSARFDYLREELEKSERRGANRFYGEFLAALFFEAFAKPEPQRSPAARLLTGRIPYLNGGLFLPHALELDGGHALRLGKTLNVADQAFQGIFELFARFSWHLDDTPGGKADEINPDVLGYIFEKYINQKAFGAYYTRPEITGYLADRSIHKLILERINGPAQPGRKEVQFDTVADLLARMDAGTALKLVTEVLPGISILDPAVGSGAFLVAALKSLVNVYYAVVGRAEMDASAELRNWRDAIKKDHPNVGYYIKRRIVTDNLYGVDIMEEACEIAKLRLFLSMVASVREVTELEPLPNIDFNILPGNSLLGLMRVDEHEFNNKQGDFFKRDYRALVKEKNRHLQAYRNAADVANKDMNLRELRDSIDKELREARGVLNELLRDRFEALGIRFEQARWDTKKEDLGKPEKRRITVGDIADQTPFHWGYVFDDIVQQRGGFDIVLTNPPWEVLKPQAKEFFAAHSDAISKNKMPIEEFEKEQTKLLQNEAIRNAWLAYQSSFPHLSHWFRAAPGFEYQSAQVDGKKTGSDINLYKLFVERSFHLLRDGGHCGIVIPSGIYTDLGATGLRELLFGQTRIEGLFCFQNRKGIFEGVTSLFKFVVLGFEKTATGLQTAGGRKTSAPPAVGAEQTPTGTTGTMSFPAAFMRHDVKELARFPDEGALWLDVELIKRMSPGSHSVMEFKSALDVQIAQKMLRFPLLGETIENTWNLRLTREFDMTNDSHLFKTRPGPGLVPLYEGKMIHQFDHGFAGPRYWVDAQECSTILKKTAARRLKAMLRAETGMSQEHAEALVDPDAIRIDSEQYRFGFRDIASSTNERSMICSVLPRGHFAGNTLNLQQPWEFVIHGRQWQQRSTMSAAQMLYVCAVLNSHVVDWLLRQKITSHLNMFYVYQAPLPRDCTNALAQQIARRAARLVCTSPEFDDLACSVGLGGHSSGASDPGERARLRAELDGLVAHLYGLDETEFAQVLGAFPLVAEPIKVAALNAWRDVQRGLLP